MNFAADADAVASTLAPAAAGDVREPDFLAILPWLRCPVDGTQMTWNPVQGRLCCEHGSHSFPVEADIPSLFAPNEWPPGKRDVTDIVKQFYETAPLPSYDGLDTRDSLRRKAAEAVLGRMLDEQIPHTASILDIGCGTGQMTNFLGMGWGRTVIGADLSRNSLMLAKEFRDRFAINNAHFFADQSLASSIRASEFRRRYLQWSPASYE
jgi:SAM-dependent methyltransferase